MQGLREKEVSMLPLLLFQFFGGQTSVIRERIVDFNVVQRVCLLQDGDIAEQLF
ncbi:MAG TPA: hypothetical protein VMT71_02155 [Syntrophorhabdales bacterium]|nr:hypothetical protein [Syntrophorhabdales bacterium]